MTHSAADRPVPAPGEPSIGTLVDALPSLSMEDLERRLELVRAAPEGEQQVMLEELETAYEELRVADEEVRAQHETITRLMESHRSLQVQQERTMAILPVPVVVTDAHGLMHSVNAAAAALVGMRVGRMHGKPIFGLFATEDRADLRRMVSQGPQDSDETTERRTATLVPRRGQPCSVQVSASVQMPGATTGEISWVLLPTGAPGGTDPRLPQALTALAVLPRRHPERTHLLEAAVAVCADALTAEVSVAIGDPTAPTAVASSSQFAQACDGAQLTAGEGPVETAFASGDVVAVAELAAERRWPRASRAFPDELVSVVAAPVWSGDGPVGTLSAYGRRPDAVPAESVELLAVTLGGVLRELELADELTRLEDNMNRALTSRAVIDQAKGIVMAARGIDADAAWDHLVKVSNVQQIKIRDLAASIVERAAQRS